MYVCGLRCPACNAYVTYCRLWPVRLYNIFPHYLINVKFFEKKLFLMKCIFHLLYKFCLKLFHILRRTERDMTKRMYWTSCKVLNIPAFFNETRIFSTDSRKILKYPNSQKCVLWEQCCSIRTDRLNSRYSEFCEHA